MITDKEEKKKKHKNWISTNCAEQVGDNWDAKEKIFRNTINAFTSDSTLQVGLLLLMNITQHHDRLTQAKWDLMQKFTVRVFYRKYENNIQVLASFGQTASTTKLVQVNWEKLKHLKSCLFV